MTDVTVKGVKGQLERVVDDQGRIYVGEWKGQDVLVLLRPQQYENITNDRIIKEIPALIKRFKKDELLREAEKELGLEVTARGYNSDNGTFDKESIAEILLGIRRLKDQVGLNKN